LKSVTVVFPGPGWKLVPASEKVTRLVLRPVRGVMVVMAGTGFRSVNLTGDVLVPPSTVVTLTSQLFGPTGASSGKSTRAVIEVDVTLVTFA
jgi:hypothetical protein